MADSEQTSSGSEETLTAAPDDQIVGVDAESGLSERRASLSDFGGHRR